MRAFVSVGLPPEVMDFLTVTQDRLRPVVGRSTVRWSRPEAMHLTLRFLSEVPDHAMGPLAEALRVACAPIAPFLLETGEVGCFPSQERARVIWVGLGGETGELERLARAVAVATDGFVAQREDRPFVPHLTLGRIADARRGERLSLPDAVAPECVRWRVGSVRLMRSILKAAGAEHIVMAEFPLARGQASASDQPIEGP